MFRRYLLRVAVLLPAFSVMAAGLATVAPAPALAEEPVATVSAQRGTVTVLRGEKAVLLVRGAEVYRADKIFTYQDARVKLRFVDGTVVAVGSDSRLIVREYLSDDSPAGRVLEMVQGILRATISAVGGGNSFDIRTRTAVASARSTDWMVEAKPDTSAASRRPGGSC